MMVKLRDGIPGRRRETGARCRETVAKAIAALVIVSSFVEGWRHVREVASATPDPVVAGVG